MYSRSASAGDPNQTRNQTRTETPWLPLRLLHLDEKMQKSCDHYPLRVWDETALSPPLLPLPLPFRCFPHTTYPPPPSFDLVAVLLCVVFLSHHHLHPLLLSFHSEHSKMHSIQPSVQTPAVETHSMRSVAQMFCWTLIEYHHATIPILVSREQR